MDQDANLQELKSQRFDSRLLQSGSLLDFPYQRISECVFEQSKLIGIEFLAARPVTPEIVLQVFDEVFTACSQAVFFVKRPGFVASGIGHNVPPVRSLAIELHFGDDPALVWPLFRIVFELLEAPHGWLILFEVLLHSSFRLSGITFSFIILAPGFVPLFLGHFSMFQCTARLFHQRIEIGFASR